MVEQKTKRTNCVCFSCFVVVVVVVVVVVFFFCCLSLVVVEGRWIDLWGSLSNFGGMITPEGFSESVVFSSCAERYANKSIFFIPVL